MTLMTTVSTTTERQRIVVRGIVQGVGFRPFVYGLAVSLDLTGFVRNDGSGVTIEIEGGRPTLKAFQQALTQRPPPLARIDAIAVESVPQQNDTAFTIVHSQPGHGRHTLISPDVAICDNCLSELFDPSDRRYHYPFINCTNCGPRFTIVQDIPYDRDKTTMRVFPLCPACQAEYDDPLDRRFHAQPNACPVCGPEISFQGSSFFRNEETFVFLSQERNVQHEAAVRLTAGEVVAVKGLGGYHLACDALNETAVATLRQRKQREARPFALMVPDLATARHLCFVSEAEADLLQSRRRPIVLLRQRPDIPIAPAVASNHTTLGLMLPYTPLHVLLLHAMAERVTSERPVVLVMTSGNISDEPITYRDAEARERLALIADSFLSHNREIYTRCDDSVARVVAGGVQLFRRARGYVPEPIRVKRPFPQPVLAVGGHLKNSFCLGKEQQAFVSHHIGDLENLETLQAFEAGVAHFMRLFDVQPVVIAHDLHPDYLSTRWAQNNHSRLATSSTALSTSCSPTLIPVQHHHAHIASVLAEHGLDGPVIGLAADGTGYGMDGAVWGGEVMTADLRSFERVAHLAYVPLPGGEQAIHQPWRMAAVYLQQAYGNDFLHLDIPFVRQLDERRWRPLAQMIGRRLNSPPTSSFGRLFDAVAALLGLRQEAVYEGQAAIELEMIAAPTETAYPFAIHPGAPLQLDVSPAVRALVADIQQGEFIPVIAGRFHRTVAELLTAVCGQVRSQTGLNRVALSGGVFQNRLLLEQLLALLEAAGFQPFINRQVPPNDGGLSLGQAAVAAGVFSNQRSVFNVQ